MDNTTVTITIDGFDFQFNDALLREYADKMNDTLYDPVILRSDILVLAPTVAKAVEKHGIDGVVMLVEKRIRKQLDIFF